MDTIAKICNRNSFGFSVEDTGTVVVSFMYNKFEPYKLMNVGIDDAYTRHIDNRQYREPKMQPLRKFSTDKEEYMDELEDGCSQSWEGIEDRTQDREDTRREGINECYDSAREAWRDKRKDSDTLAELREYEQALKKRKQMLPGRQEPSKHDLASQGKRDDNGNG